jgi:hypothetical protein
MLGIPLGILIGVITGIAAVFVIRAAWGSPKNAKPILKLLAQLLAIPTFWFGGPWLTTTMLAQIELGKILPSYLVALACTFVGITLLPLFKIVVEVGNEIGTKGAVRK